MRHKLSMLSCIAALLALNWLSPAPCRGDDDDSPGAKPAKKQAHDPVSSAFTIPYGTVLNEKQQAEYDRLKSDKESDLRDAYAAVDQAQSAADKTAARKELADLRAEVRAAMRKILAMPQREAQAAPPQHNAPQAGNAPPSASSEGNYGAGYPGSYGYMSGGVPLVAYANWPTYAGGGYGGAGYGNYWPGYYYPPFNKGEGRLINRPLDKSHRTTGAAGKSTQSHGTTPSRH